MLARPVGVLLSDRLWFEEARHRRGLRSTCAGLWLASQQPVSFGLRRKWLCALAYAMLHVAQRRRSLLAAGCRIRVHCALSGRSVARAAPTFAGRLRGVLSGSLLQ